MHLWARLPAGADDTEVARAARQAGVIVMPGQPFFPAEPPAPYLRLTFSAASSEADLRSGMRYLSSAFHGE
jgi:DNA-binding transcriptional MocR family regulator